MYTISVINPKGGCGKSTVAINIAGMYALRGFETAFLDMDGQGSGKAWLSLRPAERAPIHTAVITGRKLVLPSRMDYLIIDTPAGLRAQAMLRLAQMSGAFVIPVLPSPIDMMAAKDFLQTLLEIPQVRRGKVRIATLANRVREDTLMTTKAEMFLRDLRFPDGRPIRLLSVLRASRNYTDSIERGLTIFELAPSRCYYDQEQWIPIRNWLSAR